MYGDLAARGIAGGRAGLKVEATDEPVRPKRAKAAEGFIVRLL